MKYYKTFMLGFFLSGMLFYYDSFANNLFNNNMMRSIEIAGLVIDSETALPIEGAVISDLKNNPLGFTDSNGYFRIEINLSNRGEMFFEIKLKKDNYSTLIQKEHWGNLPGKSKVLYYFGIKKSNSKVNSFSKIIFDENDLSYLGITNFLKELKSEANFLKIIEAEKKGNENVFFKIGNNFYLVNNTGWIKIFNKDDLVSIDRNKNFPASELNSILERKNINYMTTQNSKDVPYGIFTVNKSNE